MVAENFQAENDKIVQEASQKLCHGISEQMAPLPEEKLSLRISKARKAKLLNQNPDKAETPYD